MVLLIDLVCTHIGFVKDDLSPGLVTNQELLYQEGFLVLQIPESPWVHNVVEVPLEVGLDEQDGSSPSLQHLDELGSLVAASEPSLDDPGCVVHHVLSRFLEEHVSKLSC